MKQRRNRLAQLSATTPETPMGRLLRRFWHPVALAADPPSGTARALRVLGEDLTLYRGHRGTPHLVAGRCAHRCTVLHTGWVEGDEIRCMYHGWRYDGAGVCTEMPAEKYVAPGTIRIASYPVREYAGLLFAYLGEPPVPSFELPRKDVLERSDRELAVRAELWDCNWLQQVENSLDSTHLSFAHQWPKPGRLGEEVGAAIPELHYEETPNGIRQTAVRNGTPRVSNWTFPNNNHILVAPPRPGDPWIDTVAWQVPVDDEHTLRFAVHVHPGGEQGAAMVAAGLGAAVGAPAHAAELFGEHRLPAGTNGTGALVLQDYVAVRGQGIVHDRTRERLGASDAGVALLRKIVLRELDALESGRPTKPWARPEVPFELPRPALR